MIESILNPGVLFFILGVFAALIRSDLKVPEQIISFITLYLMLAIGFSGGINLYTSGFDVSGLYAIFSVLLISAIVPVYTMWFMSSRLTRVDAAALGGTYGSNSTLTYITAVGFLTASGLDYSGYMTVALVIMELPAIIFSLMLLHSSSYHVKETLKNSMKDGTLVLLIGSMIVAFILMLLNENENVLGTFRTGDVFVGFLMFFLLYMGLRVGSELPKLLQNFNFSLVVYAIIAPIVNASIALGLGLLFGLSDTDTFLLMVLSSSSSYIVAPALYQKLLPNATVSHYLTPSIAITFPLNIMIGIPTYWWVVNAI